MRVGGRRPAPSPDGGFTLVEVVVGMVLFAVLLIAGLGLVVQSSKVAAANVRRTTAANLLTAQLEAARAARAEDVPEGVQDAAAPVGGTTYAVHREVTYASQSQTTTLCQSAGDDIVFKLVDVTITWPAMQGVAPVRGSTLLAVGVGRDGSSASRGILVVTVTDAAGHPASGAQVTVGNLSHLTDVTGCIIFPDLPPGSYSGAALGADGSDAEGQTGVVPATNLPAGYVRHVSVGLVPPPPPPPPPPPTTPPPPSTSTTTAIPPTTVTTPPTSGASSSGGWTPPTTRGTGTVGPSGPSIGPGPASSTTSGGGGSTGSPTTSTTGGGGGGGGGGGPTTPPAPTTTPPPPPDYDAS
jgi:prepilin-type N-terminal cleavage/methylation domain-containing protein